MNSTPNVSKDNTSSKNNNLSINQAMLSPTFTLSPIGSKGTKYHESLSNQYKRTKSSPYIGLDQTPKRFRRIPKEIPHFENMESISIPDQNCTMNIAEEFINSKFAIDSKSRTKINFKQSDSIFPQLPNETVLK